MSDIAHQKAPKNVLPGAAKESLATKDAHFVDKTISNSLQELYLQFLQYIYIYFKSCSC